MVKILIMDDEPALRNIVVSMIKPLGYPLFTAEDGKQAIDIGKREVPDIALLDMRVPDKDGLEVLQELKKINPNIRCIMLSGFGDVETAVSTIKQGAFDYLTKPFKIDEVLKVVNRAIDSLKQIPVSQTMVQEQTFISNTPTTQASTNISKNNISSKWIFIGGGIGLVLILGILSKFLFQGPEKISEYSIPYTNPTGMCWIKSNLWISDWVTGTVYQHNNDNKLSIASVTKITNAQPTGLTYDGESIWTCSAIERRIYKHRLDNSLTVEAIFATPNINPSGLYFDGANLWVLDAESAKIRKHKMDESLSLLTSYDSPALNPCGMFKEGEYFYIGDYRTSRIYKVAIKDFSVVEVYSIPVFEKQNLKLAGISWYNKNLWLTAENLGKVFKMPLKSLKPIKL